jgi:tetratricopeptide (TPR) repeat protein
LSPRGAAGNLKPGMALARFNDERATKEDTGMETRKARWIAAAWTMVLCGTVPAQPATAKPAQDARDPAESMALVVFEGVPGSEALLRGDYEAGLRESLEALERNGTRHAFQLSSNLCVAQLKLGDMEAARRHCGRLIESQPDRRVGAVMAQRYKAVARVNHGVLLGAQGDTDGASAEFEQARRQFPELGVARSNLERVGGSPRVTVGDAP